MKTGDQGTILVIDDNPDVLEMMQQMIVSEGFRCVAKRNPHDAITYFRTNKTDVALVITDVQMPDISGVDVFRSIKEIREDVPVIFCSAHPLKNIEDLYREGLCSFISKPFTMNDLMSELKKALAD